MNGNSRKVSLTLKITLSFVAVIIPSILFLYFVFYNLFYDRMLESEKEKAVLIAQTIEPMIGMDYYLGLESEIATLCASTIEHPLVAAIEVTIENKTIFNFNDEKTQERLNVSYPIKDPVSGAAIGKIDLGYQLEDFHQAFEDVKNKIVNSLAILGVFFLLFGLMIQQLLKPLGVIAQRVKNYNIGREIDFASIRVEPETQSIIDAFAIMLRNIKEHNIMLERYKYAVDESAIVSKSDLNGRITYVNNEFCKVSGYSREELLGENHNILRHPDMKAETFENMWQTLKQNKTWKGVLKNRKKDGSSYYVKTIILPIFDENMRPIEYMSLRHDITQIVKQQEQIARQTTDMLTGLPNRIKLEEDIKAYKSPKLALFALDNFNIIEDYYGYDIGNKTIIDTAVMLKAYIKESGISIYTLSSGQFALLVGETIEVNAFSDFCANVLKKIDEYIVELEDESFNIRATAGLTFLQHNALSNASLALHHAKETRKDSVVYEETDNIIKVYENNLNWTKKIKNALLEERITVFVQPIFAADSLEANKYECLVRMIDEDGKIISPYFFLEIAKKSKLYLQITKKVIEISFDAFSKMPNKTFSINISVDDLLDKETMAFLISKMKEYDIASRLILEIVESEGIEGYDDIITTISELKAFGCQIAIDDFGTGYSNFAYLMQLNVDIIKIDGSLIKNIVHDVNSQIISKTILDFANQLELTTVAEFIHNEEVMQYVQNMGIDYLQGFHLGEPAPIASLLEEVPL